MVEKSSITPEGATHFLRYENGCIAWYKAAEENGFPLIREWDEFNKYWVVCIHTQPYYENLGLAEIGSAKDATKPTQQTGEGPSGATHRYVHGGLVSWYRETADNLFVWRDGSWHGSAFKGAEELMESCPLGLVTMLGFEQDEHPEPAEDDLAWLARNAQPLQPGKWVRRKFGFDASGSMKANGYEVADDGNQILASGFWISSDTVLARRADMQNKPSWDTAPEWAEWLAQVDTGVWFFSAQPVEIHESGKAWWSHWRPGTKITSPTEAKGEVIGDWRDTLERRPTDMHKTTPEIDTSAERVQKSAESMHDWFERGKLPPVGTKCEYQLRPSATWYPCEIKYVIHDDGVVMMREDGFEQFCSINSKFQPVSFRPIRTERHELIEIITSNLNGTAGQVAEAILAAGFKRGDA